MWQISRPPCEWHEFGQVFNGQLGHLYKLGDWKTAESWPMLKFCWSELFKMLCHRVTESQTPKGTQVGEIFWCLISINSPTRFARRGIKMSNSIQFKHCICFFEIYPDFDNTDFKTIVFPEYTCPVFER